MTGHPTAVTDPVVAAAEARAVAAVQQGIADLIESYKHAPEHERHDRPDGRSFWWTSPRPEIAGHLRRLGINPDTIEREQ